MDSLTGQLLIAMPGMSDPRFERSVIFMCEHSEKGAMGMIVNKPAQGIDAADLFDQLEIETDSAAPPIAIHIGGPVETQRGFVLHSGEWGGRPGTIPVSETVAMTATLDILHALARGGGPDRAILLLGYAGWGPGQLEGEFRANGWLACAGDAGIVFHPDPTAKWTLALRTLGVDAQVLSGTMGRA